MAKCFIAVFIFFSSFPENPAWAQEESPFHIIEVFHIISAGGWDYLAIQPGSNNLYVSHSTQVNILDKNNGDSLGVILNTTGVHGIAFDVADSKGFTSNGRLNNVTPFDLKTFQPLSLIATGNNPDAIMYDPFSKMVITCNGATKDLSVIDPVQDKVVGTIQLDGKPETAVTNAQGKLYVNIEDKSEIAEVDITSMKVTHVWPIGPGQEPTGLAFDKKTNRLFAGCGNKLLIVLNAITGEVVAKLPIGDGCDGVGFDNGTNNIFSSNGEGTLSVYHEKSDQEFEFVATVPTKKGARTIAIDQETHLIYLPTADFEAVDAKDPNPPKRPKMIPGTFQVLVVGQ